MNRNGNPANLVASHPGNQHALRSGIYSSGRVLAPRAAEVADALMELPHAAPLDRLAAKEIGALIALLERIDATLAERPLENRGGRARTLLDVRAKLSGRLDRWLTQFGATPASRADFAATLAQGGLAAEIARRRAEAVDGD